MRHSELVQNPWQRYQPEHIDGIYDHILRPAGLELSNNHWTIASYDEAARVLDTRNPEVDNSNTLLPLTPRAELARNVRAWPSLIRLTCNTQPVTADAHDPTHAAVRRALFTPRHPASINYAQTVSNYDSLVRTVVESAGNDLSSHLKEGQTDLAAVFARPIASTVIRKAVGFYDADDADVRTWSDAQTSLLGRYLNRNEQVRGLSGLADLAVACRGLVSARRRSGDTSGIAGMLAQSDLSTKQAGSALMNVMAAGYSTTYGTILNATRRLLSDRGREYWDELPNLDEPTTNALMRELTRLETGLIGWKRRAKTDMLIGKSTIPKGSPMVVHLGAANRDPDMFTNPHDIQLDRTERGEPAPLSFGTGPHVCVGKALAQLELKRALQTLRAVAPDLREAGHFTPYDPDYLFRTPQELIVHSAAR